MACCEPPCTRTEPTSTLTFRFRAAVKEPVISWAQFPPSRNTRVCGCCAVANGVSMISSVTSLENVFNSSLSLLVEDEVETLSFHKPIAEISQSLSVNLGQLSQHATSLRADVRALIILS